MPSAGCMQLGRIVLLDHITLVLHNGSLEAGGMWCHQCTRGRSVVKPTPGCAIITAACAREVSGEVTQAGTADAATVMNCEGFEVLRGVVWWTSLVGLEVRTVTSSKRTIIALCVCKLHTLAWMTVMLSITVVTAHCI